MTTMKCPKCGKEISEDSIFCEYCGYMLHSEKQDKKHIYLKYLWIIFIPLIVSIVAGIFCCNIIRQKKQIRSQETECISVDSISIKGNELLDTIVNADTIMQSDTMLIEKVDSIKNIKNKQDARTKAKKKAEKTNVDSKTKADRISTKENMVKKMPPASDFTETAFGIRMRMIWVEGGDFLMGCTDEQNACAPDEENVRHVTLDGFYVGMLEVTQSQWEKVCGTNVYQQRNKVKTSLAMRGVGDDYPMYYVNWEEAMEFCHQLSQKTGLTYTLPTEAQWEYAARGGKKADSTIYAGSNKLDDVAWYIENSRKNSTTHPCGTKRANALGIYDMSGNVWEWCKDKYSDSYISYDTYNPSGPSSGEEHVSRGGSWNYNASNCRVANRHRDKTEKRSDNLGFRVVILP